MNRTHHARHAHRVPLIVDSHDPDEWGRAGRGRRCPSLPAAMARYGVPLGFTAWVVVAECACVAFHWAAWLFAVALVAGVAALAAVLWLVRSSATVDAILLLIAVSLVVWGTLR